MQFYQQRIAITFADVFYPTRIRPQKLLRLREKDPEHNWMDVGGGSIYVLLPLSRRQTAFRRFYRPERVPTKHLQPYPATNIIMYTSIALPMAQLSTLNIYSCMVKSGVSGLAVRASYGLQSARYIHSTK